MRPTSPSSILLFVHLAQVIDSSLTNRAHRQDMFDHKVDIPTKRPLVIAHRGASGSLPEHTLLAYQRAIDEGADVIECDVTLTRDLVPVCLHENWLGTTTDVSEHVEYSDRKSRKLITDFNGLQVTYKYRISHRISHRWSLDHNP